MLCCVVYTPGEEGSEKQYGAQDGVWGAAGCAMPSVVREDGWGGEPGASEGARADAGASITVDLQCGRLWLVRAALAMHVM